jgi:hypothetical protein
MQPYLVFQQVNMVSGRSYELLNFRPSQCYYATHHRDLLRIRPLRDRYDYLQSCSPGHVDYGQSGLSAPVVFLLAFAGYPLSFCTTPKRLTYT